jgi:hypothetical protein
LVFVAFQHTGDFTTKNIDKDRILFIKVLTFLFTVNIIVLHKKITLKNCEGKKIFVLEQRELLVGVKQRQNLYV